ncbi:RDD family protein [Ornithinicoccus halotolerans]|uniref:RDD family protein n=1 Tax=Ornithinicoccus halotolerans TaxID=1748220 RepID=UPI001885D80A|nr:RDD family protein [Ornithinicoccus halotolerans]
MPDSGTRAGLDGAGLVPRRVLARALDAGLAVALSCVLVWPLAWGAISEAAGQAGVPGVSGVSGLVELLRILLTDQDALAAAAASQLRPTVLGTVLLQAVVVWLYETVSTIVTGVTPGKAVMRLRVVPERTATVGPAPAPPAHPLLDRAVRMAVRALLVVAPPAVAVLALTSLALAVPGAVEAAELAIALMLAVALLALRGRGLHGHLSGTSVVPFSWQQATADARQRVTAQARERGRSQEAGRAAGRPQLEGYLQRLREAASGLPRSQELELGRRFDDTVGRVSQTARREARGAQDTRRPGPRTPARRG